MDNKNEINIIDSEVKKLSMNEAKGESSKEIARMPLITNNQVSLKFLFFRVIKGEQEHFDPTKVETVGIYKIPHNNRPFLDIIDDFLDKCNSHLKEFLEKEGIKHFIPFTRWSCTIKDGIVELCYYFSQDQYNTIYKTDPRYVMMPAGKLETIMNGLYKWYNLSGFYDPLARNL